MTKVEKRKALFAEMAALDELAKKEARSFTDEESTKFNELEAQIKQLDAEIEAEARAAKVTALKPNSEGEQGKSESFMEVRNGKIEIRTDMTDADGGKAIAPEQFVNEIIKEAEKEALLYARVSRIPVTGAGSLGLPYEAEDASDSEWTAEVPDTDIEADAKWKFGKKNLAPTDLTKLIKISRKLLATSAFPIETLARQKITSKLIAAFENGIMSGTGSGQPLGIFTASADGINTDRDIETATTGVVTADDIINAYMKLRPAYRKNACWVMNTAVLTQVMKLKGTDGQFIWKESMREGQPSTLLGLPVLESEYAPNGTDGVFASGDYMLALGDLKHYQFAYWKGLDLTVDNLTFIGKNQIGIYGHTLADGQPTLPAAFVRVVSK